MRKDIANAARVGRAKTGKYFFSIFCMKSTPMFIVRAETEISPYILQINYAPNSLFHSSTATFLTSSQLNVPCAYLRRAEPS